MILALELSWETVEQMSIPVCSTEFVWGATVCRDHRLFLWNHWWNIFNSLITEHLPYGSHAIIDNIMIWEEKNKPLFVISFLLKYNHEAVGYQMSAGAKNDYSMKWGMLDR